MFDEKQLTILEALVDCVIPPDDYPGGWEAGVGDYLLRQFERDLKDMLPTYQSGLLALDTEALTVYKKTFADLAANDKIHLLTNVEQGKVQSEWTVNPAEFFTLVVNHCAEGFYSDPRNGGNKNQVAWKMIGFEVTA